MGKISIAALELKEDTIKGNMKSVVDNGSIMESIVTDVITPYVRDLDNLVDKITGVLNDENNPNLSSDELESALLRITTILYYVTDKAESVGIRSDIATSARKEVYNRIIRESQGTVNEKVAMAEEESTTERLTEIVFNRAYNKIKNRIQIGLELQASLKKIMSRRMESMVVEQ